jgi:hypothetical protein
LNSEEAKAAFERGAKARGYAVEQFFEEVTDEKLKAGIRESFEASAANKKPIVKNTSNAMTYTKHGALHELTHFVTGYLTSEMEMEAYKMFIRAREPGHPLYHLYIKNMCRALASIKEVCHTFTMNMALRFPTKHGLFLKHSLRI